MCAISSLTSSRPLSHLLMSSCWYSNNALSSRKSVNSVGGVIGKCVIKGAGFSMMLSSVCSFVCPSVVWKNQRQLSPRCLSEQEGEENQDDRLTRFTRFQLCVVQSRNRIRICGSLDIWVTWPCLVGSRVKFQTR